MATKRKLTIERKEDRPAEGPPAEAGASWKDWLLKKYAAWWYWVAALFLDVVIFLEAQRSLQLDVMIAIPITVLAIFIEVYIYLRIWGRGGPLGNKEGED